MIYQIADKQHHAQRLIRGRGFNVYFVYIEHESLSTHPWYKYLKCFNYIQTLIIPCNEERLLLLQFT